MKNKLTLFLLLVLIVNIPFLSIGQTPGPGEGGADAVPFDDNMNLLFLIVGFAFALIITLKHLRRKEMAGKYGNCPPAELFPKYLPTSTTV